MLFYRLVGLILAIGGAALLLFISYALYTRTETAPSILIDIGMPATLLATLMASFTVGSGVWLAGFAPRRAAAARSGGRGVDDRPIRRLIGSSRRSAGRRLGFDQNQ